MKTRLLRKLRKRFQIGYGKDNWGRDTIIVLDHINQESYVYDSFAWFVYKMIGCSIYDIYKIRKNFREAKLSYHKANKILNASA